MTVLSLADVLDMPLVRAGSPRVLAGAAHLDRAVRWVHSGELADIGSLLREGDLLLSTGIAMPTDVDDLRQVVDGLAVSGAAGLVIELGRRWTTLPDALVEACESRGLPLVALAREVRFAAVAQAVGEQIVDQQVAALREAQRVHETFTDLSIAEAAPAGILEAVQRLSGAAVILESEQHHVLDYRAGQDDIASVLTDWIACSRQIALDGRTTWDEERGWLVTRIGRKERGWGRLVVRLSERPTEGQVATAERAAAALALHRLHDRQRDSALRRAHHELIVALLADPTTTGLQQRCEVAGLPTTRRQLVGLALRPVVAGDPRTPPGSRVEDVVAAAVNAAHDLKAHALVCHLDGDVRAVLALPLAANADRLVDQLSERVAQRHAVVTGVGRPVSRWSEVDRTLREARQVVDSAHPHDLLPGTVHRLEDIGIRGLLALFADDDRVRAYAERQLAALREHEQSTGTSLEPTLAALLQHPASKSDAAASLHISRSVFYDRLARIGRLLQVDLDDPETRVSLHVALMVDGISRRRRTSG